MMRYDAKTAAISQTKELNVRLCTIEQVESVRIKKKNTQLPRAYFDATEESELYRAIANSNDKNELLLVVGRAVLRFLYVCAY